MMLTQRTCKYLFILAFSALLGCSSQVYAQTDTEDTDTTTAPKVKKADLAGHQLSIGFDIIRPIANYYVTDRYGYEFMADYYLHNEFYLVAEGGRGGSKVDYTDLKYTTTNNFFRFGFNKEILARDNPKDWDMMFFGIRAGYAGVQRSAATFTIVDSLWGSVPGSGPGKSFSAVWLELAGGMRVELVKGLSAGWTGRAKFIMNGRSFSDLSPLYIAGFGKGDKTTNFDLNIYITYAIRWKRKNAPAVVVPEKK